MICTVIQHRYIDEIYEIIEEIRPEMAEIRLDNCPMTNDEIDELFSCSDVPLIATCRITEKNPASVAESKILTAIKAGAAYVDLEIDAPAMMSKRIRREASEYGTLLIRSFHDFKGCDSSVALRAIADKCMNLGADVVKIATYAPDDDAPARILSLYDDFKSRPLVAFCMGEKGVGTRLECLKKGAPFTYSCISEEEASAPGQIPVSQMFQKVYGPIKMPGYSHCSGKENILEMPSSKSFAQRAIIMAALANGTSTLLSYTDCEDSASALRIAEKIGAEVHFDKKNKTLKITGINAHKDMLSISDFNVGESGLLARLIIPLGCVLNKGKFRISGEKTLLNRELKGVKDIMSSCGIMTDGDKIPVSITGKFNTRNIQITGNTGSQIISGLLAALPINTFDTGLTVSSPKSIPYIFMTMDVMRKFGINITNEMEGDEEFVENHDWDKCESMSFEIQGNKRYTATDMTLEADWSAAANFLVAGAIFGKVAISGLDMKSIQADLSIMDILMEAGASISHEEDTNIIRVQKAPLYAFEINASNCPDLFPIVSVLASFCQGTSKISGVSRLRNKESDRAETIVSMLTAMGVNCHISKDTLMIKGHSLAQRCLSGKLLKGGKYSSHHDHRMVMALKMAEFGADSPIEIDDTECVSKSFPEFFDILKRM